MPFYGNQGNQSCGQGFAGQNSCGQGFLGQTGFGFQNPNQVMPGFQNFVNQAAGTFGFAVPGSMPFQQGSGNFAPENGGSTGYSQGNSSQGDSVSLIRRLLQTMGPREVQMVFQSAGDQLSSGRSLFIPERLGQAQEEVGGEFLPDERGMVLPGPRSSNDKSDERDAFSRNEKWIGAPPIPPCERWKNREDEIVGFSTYVAELSSWASQGSVSFGKDIEQSARWNAPIAWIKLSREQQSRAVRLCAILRSAFSQHGRISLLISGFLEGLDIEPGYSSGDVFGNTSTYLGNGYELLRLRQLSREFCLRSRSAALSLRAQLMAKELKADSAAGSACISDVICQNDVACARYMRMISTLTGDLSGLKVEDSDQLTMLVKSLPSEARTYTLPQSSGESYGAYRLAARKFEHQHRLFRELQMSRKPVFGAVEHFETPNLSMGSDSFEHDETVLGGEGTDGVAAGVGAPSKGTSTILVAVALTFHVPSVLNVILMVMLA